MGGTIRNLLSVVYSHVMQFVVYFSVFPIDNITDVVQEVMLHMQQVLRPKGKYSHCYNI